MNENQRSKRVGLFSNLEDNQDQDRVNAIDVMDLNDFSVKKRKQDPENTFKNEVINKIAEENNFPSREAKVQSVSSIGSQRRYRTGRSYQLNIKATLETVEKFYRIADMENIPLGKLLEQSLNAYEKQMKKI
jgi:hypothetical protein